MLKKIILENWKSYRYAELPIDPLTVLIGTNASGKSNLIEALEYLRRIATGFNFDDAFNGISGLPPMRGAKERATYRNSPEFSLTAIVQKDVESREYVYRISIFIGSNFRIAKESLVDRTNNKTLFETQEPKYGLRKMGISARIGERQNWANSLVSNTPFFRGDRAILSILVEIENKENQELFEEIRTVQRTLSDIFVLSPVPERMRNESFLTSSLAEDASNIAGVLAYFSQNQDGDFNPQLLRYIQGIPEGDIQEIWAEPIGRLGTKAMLYCREKWQDSEPLLVDAGSLSDGTLRFLGILTALLTRPQGSQIAIEDVENGLHSSRLIFLLKMLQDMGEEREIDLLITTHNTDFLDTLPSDTIPFTVVCHRDRATGESKLTLLEEIENFPKLFASAPLSKLIKSGAIERNAARTL